MSQSLVGLSLTSLFSDFSHEWVTALLPAYLASIGGTAATLGAIEGISDGLSTFFKLYSGWLSDHRRDRKWLVVLGYATTGLLLPLVAFASRIWEVAALRVIAWTARGFRDPLRDVLLVESVDEAHVNRAFGFHRAMDTTGAVLGPACAALGLWGGVGTGRLILPALIPGILSPIWLSIVNVSDPKGRRTPIRTAMKSIPPEARRFLCAVAIFGAGNFSHTLLILVALDAFKPTIGQQGATIAAVVIYLIHNILYASLTYPWSRLGDAVGPANVVLLGYMLFGILCVTLSVSSGPATVVIALALAGTYVAAIDPMEPAAIVRLIDAKARGSALGVLASVNGVGDFVSSALVGYLWSAFGQRVAFGYAAVMTAIAVVALVWTLSTFRNVRAL